MNRVREFLASIASDWIGRMSGGGGLLFTVVGFFVPAQWQRQGFLFLGVACLFYASFRAWVALARERDELLSKLQPHLELFRQPDAKPFFEEQPVQAGSKTRYLRVGVRNAGGTDIPHARLVLEACEPGTSAGVHPEHELQPMGRPLGTLTFMLPAHGSVLVDVATEFVSLDEQFRELHLCYAQGMANTLPPIGDDRYRLVLRAEGGGPSVRYALDLGGRLTWRLDGLTPLARN
ncbi:MAG TPA: hypothetical protein VGQ19_20240 [Burkholderiales bacterium]|jgi:hypothetical protein|nr:hypothetical protein [Burkholderiales bacterium]